jgi:hypothetical protein
MIFSARVRFAEKQVRRFREDVGDWQNEREPVGRTFLSIEDVLSAGRFYVRAIMRCPAEDAEAYLGVRCALRMWLETSQQVLKHVEDLEKERGQVEGAVLIRSEIEMVRRRLDSARPIHINADFREESNLPIPHPISFAKRPIVPDFFGL